MDMVLPRGCAVCGLRIPFRRCHNGYECFCDKCGSGVRHLVPPFCRICGTEVYGVGGHNPLCGKCLKNPPPFSIARSVVRYEKQVQQLVHKLKYGNELSVIPGLAELIKKYDMTEFADVDCIVVVPLSLQRLRKRGLNQAVVLARLFFADRPAAIKSDWLVRTRNTMPQTELGRVARMKNLTGAFQARHDFQGAGVCLVDDVFTTGTTVTECSKVIMENGAADVKVLTLARVNVPRSGRYLSL
ncbi:MAG: ComF family protein [Desulforhopalus sp.]